MEIFLKRVAPPGRPFERCLGRRRCHHGYMHVTTPEDLLVEQDVEVEEAILML